MSPIAKGYYHDKSPKFSEAMDILSKRDGSPCLKCMVSVSCRKSFVDHSACQKFAKFIQTELVKEGIFIKD